MAMGWLSNLYGGAVQLLYSPPYRKNSPTVQGLNFTHNLQRIAKNMHYSLLKTCLKYFNGYTGHFKATLFFNQSIPLRKKVYFETPTIMKNVQMYIGLFIRLPIHTKHHFYFNIRNLIPKY